MFTSVVSLGDRPAVFPVSLMKYSKAEHQVAGHDGALVDDTGMVFIKPSTEQEIQFYTQIQAMESSAGDDDNEEALYLTDFLPAFMGTLQHGISEQVEQSQQVTDELRQMHMSQSQSQTASDIDPSIPYLVLENLLYPYKHPSIIDIKLGSVLHDENSSNEKRERLQRVSEETTSGSLHYRVCGMKLYGDKVPDLSKFDNADGHVTCANGYVTFDKWFGRALTKETVLDNFTLFFMYNRLSHEQQQSVVQNIVVKLQLLYNTLIDQELRIRSGSLLFIYENDVSRWEAETTFAQTAEDDYHDDDDDDEEDEDYDTHPGPLSQLNMIDFAHAKFTPGQGPDDDILDGIHNLITALETLLQD